MVIIAVKNLQDRMAMKRRRGSVPRRITVPRNRAADHEALMQDYFAEVPTCNSSQHEIIENERDMSLKFFFDNVGSRVRPERNPGRIQAFFETYQQIKDSATHTQLNKDLIEHHWQLHRAR
jgi:hypothetical protein